MENHVIRQHVAMTWSARSSIGDIGGADVAEESYRREKIMSLALWDSQSSLTLLAGFAVGGLQLKASAAR